MVACSAVANRLNAALRYVAYLTWLLCVSWVYRTDWLWCRVLADFALYSEAEAGYTGCRNCGFENFKRSALCGLCGVKVACEGSLEKRITESLACGSLQSQRLQRARCICA